MQGGDVYLADDATSDQVDQSRHELAALPHVRAVEHIDKSQALAQAQKRPGLGDLASLSDSNPFPASLEVHVDTPSNVPAVAKVALAELSSVLVPITVVPSKNVTVPLAKFAVTRSGRESRLKSAAASATGE